MYVMADIQKTAQEIEQIHAEAMAKLAQLDADCRIIIRNYIKDLEAKKIEALTHELKNQSSQ